MRLSAQETAIKIYQDKFPRAKVLLLAGSVIRGEATEHSDLDIVVVFEHLKSAYRESFIFEGWPVEVFVHDQNTLKYFFEKIDGPSGVPSLPNMVLEGQEISNQPDFTNALKLMAKDFLEAGPPAWTKDDMDRNRYLITDLCDDLRSPRSYQEMVGTLGQLQEHLTHFYFRSQRKWTGKGKTMAKRWNQDNPTLANEFFDALAAAYKTEESSRIINFSEKILTPFGGWGFSGHRMEAPEKWRSM